MMHYLLPGYLFQDGVASLGVIDPAAVGVSSCLLMPEERKFLAFDDSVVGCVDGLWFAKGAGLECCFCTKWLMPLLILEPYAGERWTAAVRLAWRWKGKITAEDGADGLGAGALCKMATNYRMTTRQGNTCDQTDAPQSDATQHSAVNRISHQPKSRKPQHLEQREPASESTKGGFPLFCGCMARDDSDAEGCWFGVLFLYEVVDATFTVGAISWCALDCCCSACVEVERQNYRTLLLIFAEESPCCLDCYAAGSQCCSSWLLFTFLLLKAHGWPKDPLD
ncbi:hypothetical protein Nepgr_014727 [Nepenthes gracilis]|uniref:Uncharacterized protein n=1 Tax=Nepenthes gracilis TaxID=150966 RepID=A0AAD3XQL8_NEPGR|nr:hypothetical protein Nepgr_014727 [Nepenthes gracilis]